MRLPCAGVGPVAAADAAFVHRVRHRDDDDSRRDRPRASVRRADRGHAMSVRSALARMAAVLLSLPFGYGAGVISAYVIGGREFGQWPVITVPVALVGSIAYALWPASSASARLRVMAVGTLVVVIVFAILARTSS